MLVVAVLVAVVTVMVKTVTTIDTIIQRNVVVSVGKYLKKKKQRSYTVILEYITVCSCGTKIPPKERKASKQYIKPVFLTYQFFSVCGCLFGWLVFRVRWHNILLTLFFSWRTLYYVCYICTRSLFLFSFLFSFGRLLLTFVRLMRRRIL